MQDNEIAGMTDIAKVIQKYIKLDRDVTDTMSKYHEISNVYSRTTYEVTVKRQALEAFSETIKMFDDQMKLQKKFQTEAQSHEIANLSENSELLKQRLKSLEESKLHVEESLKQLIVHNRSLERQMNTLKVDIFQMVRSKKKHTSWLKENGMSQEKIYQLSQNTASSQRGMIFELDLDVHTDETSWLCLETQRSDADRILVTRPEGTFLIRRSSLGQYALSIMCNGKVNHCRILVTERGYGFAEPYTIHSSLRHLVLHYAQTSLEEHNESLTTTLTYPAFASSSALARLQTQRQLQVQQMTTELPRSSYSSPTSSRS